MSQPRLVEQLREFDAFSGLPDDDLLIMASRAQVKAYASGATLFQHGDEDARIVCLAKGTVELVAPDGRSHRIDAGTQRAGQPIARLQPRQYTATALTPIEVLCVNSEGFGNWHIPVNPGHYEVEEFGDTAFQVQDDAHHDHRESLKDAKLELPSLPTIALEARRIIDRDDAGVATVAKLVMNDPAIAAKLVKAANSPLYYGREAIDSCERAVLRLGLATTRQLVVAFAVRELFENQTPGLQSLMTELWAHSTEVAAICYVLSRKLKLFDPQEAQLAGLLHDIGVVPILTYCAKQSDLQDDPEAAQSLVQQARASIGSRMLRAWNFPDSLIAVVRESEDWWRDNRAEPELADLVLVAQLIGYMGKVGIVNVPPLIRLPAFKKIGRGELDYNATLKLMEEAAGQIAEIQSLLRS